MISEATSKYNRRKMCDFSSAFSIDSFDSIVHSNGRKIHDLPAKMLQQFLLTKNCDNAESP